MSATQEINTIIKNLNDWRGTKLAQLRTIILQADHELIEEVKWKKPSKPEGVPVWSHDGILCVGESLKNAVRLTFPKGAQLKDSKKIFNTRLDSNTVRAIDFFEDSTIDETALAALIVDAGKINSEKRRG